MYRKNNDNSNENNFWISYADMMAGLLFVFILLIGAIVTKYITSKSNVVKLEKDLENEQSVLTKTQKLIILKDSEIDSLNKIISEKEKKLKEIELESKQKIISLEDLLKETNSIITTKDEELLKLLTALEEQEKKHEKIVADIKKERDLNISKMQTLLNEQQSKHEKLVADLQSTKAKIKNLTGMKIKVISALKRALGDKMSIDPKSGSIRVSANILFDQGKSKLKDGAKKELKKIFTTYIKALILNDEIRKHLDKIIIEGHTNSDGSYLYNLELSQRRAYEVMQFLFTLDFTKKYNIKKQVTASGRSYLDLIYDDKGREDKDASRRIEIKFLLKNEDAMREIEKILENE